MVICASLAPPRRFVLLSCFMLLLLLRVVASRSDARLEPQLSKSYGRTSWPQLSTSMAQRANYSNPGPLVSYRPLAD